MTVTQKLFKILSGHDLANGRTDGRHTIICPKFHFGRIKGVWCSTKTTFNVYVSYQSQTQFKVEYHAVYSLHEFSLSNKYTVFVENHNL